MVEGSGVDAAAPEHEQRETDMKNPVLRSGEALDDLWLVNSEQWDYGIRFSLLLQVRNPMHSNTFGSTST